jgi:ADP-heptose:LPS heptosyltransferase
VKRLVIKQQLAPGDAVVLTALVRDLMATHPGEYEIYIDTKSPQLWRHNPNIVHAGLGFRMPEAQYVTSEYGEGLKRQNYETIHFLSWLYRDFKERTGIDVPVRIPRGDLHLAENEKTPMAGLPHHYWVLVAGGKIDIPTKVWEAARWQQVVNLLREKGIRVVQAGSVSQDNWQPELEGVHDMVGRTMLRDTLQLVQNAAGVLCGVSYPMHLAAALEKPCVVVAGGREAWWWEAYHPANRGFLGAEKDIRVPHRFLHTIGRLDCAPYHGCWRQYLRANAKSKPHQICKRLIARTHQDIPECLHLITPEMVVENVMAYYLDGSIIDNQK